VKPQFAGTLPRTAASRRGVIPKQRVPDLIRDVKRFSDKIVPKDDHGGAAFTLSSS
jgi:hypothetical protein